MERERGTDVWWTRTDRHTGGRSMTTSGMAVGGWPFGTVTRMKATGSGTSVRGTGCSAVPTAPPTSLQEGRGGWLSCALRPDCRAEQRGNGDPRGRWLVVDGAATPAGCDAPAASRTLGAQAVSHAAVTAATIGRAVGWGGCPGQTAGLTGRAESSAHGSSHSRASQAWQLEKPLAFRGLRAEALLIVWVAESPCQLNHILVKFLM